MSPQKHSQYFKIFFLWFSIAIICIFLFSSYIKSEVLTNIYASQIHSINTLCQRKNSDLKYYKIISYEKRRRELIIQCVYQEGLYNSEVIANMIGDKWEQVRVNKLNEKGGLYWPIYI